MSKSGTTGSPKRSTSTFAESSGPMGTAVSYTHLEVDKRQGIICDAIRREIQRGGQVYYLHNRIASIERPAIKIREMLDNEDTVGVAHGQMDKDMLASVMEDVLSLIHI